MFCWGGLEALWGLAQTRQRRARNVRWTSDQGSGNIRAREIDSNAGNRRELPRAVVSVGRIRRYERRGGLGGGSEWVGD